MKKKLLSLLLSAAMLTTMLPTGAFAKEEAPADAGDSYFDFEASEYLSDETDGSLEVRVCRHGGTAGEVNVAIKAADFLSTYGEDYELLIDGEPMTAKEGSTVDPSQFVWEEDGKAQPGIIAEDAQENDGSEIADGDAEENTGSEIADEDAEGNTGSEIADGDAQENTGSEIADENTQENTGSEIADGDTQENTGSGTTDEDTQENTDSEISGGDAQEKSDSETTAEASLQNSKAEAATEAADLMVNAEKKTSSTGSALRDAQAAYLNLPTEEDTAETENAAAELLDSLYGFFRDSQGAEGVLHFADGEEYHTVTVRLLDNDEPDGERIFLLGLLGTDTENTTIAPNATTYVTISDDEAQEPAVFSLEASRTALTADNPTAEVTVRRTAGLQYFSTAYVSTVTETAEQDDYEAFSLKTVAFAPGQETVTVPVTGLDFSRGGSFGVRLESEETDQVKTHYLSFTLEQENAVLTSSEEQVNNALRLSGGSGTYFGDASRRYGSKHAELIINLDEIEPPQYSWDELGGGFGSETGPYQNNRNFVRLEDVKDIDGVTKQMLHAHIELASYYSLIYTKNPINMIGVKNISYSLYVSGDGDRQTNVGMGIDQQTNVGMGIDQSYEGYTADDRFSGNTDVVGMPWWLTRSIPDVGHLWNWNNNECHYFKFALARGPKSYIENNHVDAYVDGVTLDYAKYSFDMQPWEETIPGYLYDFTNVKNGEPNKINIYRCLGTAADGSPIYSDTNMYKPPALSMKTTDGQDIAGFYANWSGQAVLEPSEPLALGIKLKGAYFNGWYISASDDGKIYVDLNQDFIKHMMNKGFIPDTTQDTTIHVNPDYEQKTVTVNFDYLGHEPNAQGSYADGEWNAEIRNLSLCSQLEKKKDNNDIDCYTFEMPAGSVIRVGMTPAADRTAAGFRYWTRDGSINKTVWYQEGSPIASGSDSTTTVSETDYTMAEIIVLDDMSIVPVTGAQDLYVGYFPSSPGITTKRPELEHTDPETGKVTTTDDYTKVVIGYTRGVPESEEAAKGTDKDGSMTMTDVRINDQIVLMSSPPSGYHTIWTDMTGDTNNDGKVDDKEAAAAGIRRDPAQSNYPKIIWGNELTLPIHEDNTRYYYQFDSGNNDTTVSGEITRENRTFYDLVYNTPKVADTPVAGAFVNIAGAVGQTDKKGKYTVSLKGVSNIGNVCGTVEAEGVTYNIVGSIERFTTFRLDALEQFTARSLAASYANNTDKASGQIITICDDTLTLTAKIDYYGAVIPRKAHFTIVRSDGTLKLDCDGASGYTTTVEDLGGNYLAGQGGTFQAALSFNPLQDLSSGDKIYVAFEDQSGHVYAPINLGYQFFSEISLKDLLLPVLGPDFMEAYSSDFVSDLIGDPLAGFDLGKISNLGQNTNPYTPAGLIGTTDETTHTWSRSTFEWNYSKEFKPKDTDDVKNVGKNVASKSEDELKRNTTTNQIPGDTTKPGQSGSRFSTKGSFNFSITPTVGFQLTLSQRKLDDDGSIKIYFEDLVLYLKCDASFEANQRIQTPIGLSVLINVKLTGNQTNKNPIITGIYTMYVDYGKDSYEKYGAVPYDANFDFFKSSNSSIRREGYIFLDPELAIKLGIGVGVANVWGQAEFAFDMDFHFTADGVQDYGQLNITEKWGVTILSFDVYSKDIKSQTVELFNKDASGPFGFDGLVNSKSMQNRAMQTALDVVNDEMSGSGGDFAPTLSDRSYLNNRSAWNGGSDGMLQATGSAVNGSTETEMRTGTSQNQQFRLVPFGDKGQALAVFVDDDPDRSDVNARAVYYSVRGTDGSWSEPRIIDDDGSLDDYPYAEDLDDGRILVAWSSAETVLDQNATLEESLQSLAIEYAVFNTETQTMGAGKYLTHATELDISGDLMPRIAFDRNSKKAILYYTKTEYKDLQELNDISEAYSAIAYLLYDPETGSWNNTGDSYTDEELIGMTDAEKEAYRKNWYGQRFLDLRLDTSSDKVPLVVESEAIDYNGLGLFAYVVDWDEDQNTLDDRDVFLQTYDFATGEFTHIIRISPETGCYADPELEDSNHTCYLFFGMQDPETGDGTIRTMDIGYYLTKGSRAEVTNGKNRYHVLQHPDGSPVEAVVATVCHNMQDYTTIVTDEGKLCLLWTDVPDAESGRDIHAAIYNNKDGQDEPDAEASNEPPSRWSKPVVITGSDKDTFYTGFGAMAYDGAIVILSSKGSFSDRASHGVVQVIHRPFARIELDGKLELGDDYAAEGDHLSVTATLNNVGLKQDHDGETVTFYVNGREADTVSYDSFIPGGSSARVSTTILVPAGEVEITAKCNNTEASATIRKEAHLSARNEMFGYVTGRDRVPTYERLYSAVVFNDGNKPTGNMKLTAAAGDKVLAETTVAGIAPKDFADVELLIPFDETLYELDETTGLASLDVEVSLTAGEEELYSCSETLTRQYDAEAVAALKTYQGVSGLSFTMNVGDYELLLPEIKGEDLTVDWIRSSNPEVAWLDYNGEAYAASEGTTTLTGVIIPNRTVQELHVDGTFRRKDWSELVPASLLTNTVTATVKVGMETNTVVTDFGNAAYSYNGEVTYTGKKIKPEKDLSVTFNYAELLSDIPVTGEYSPEDLVKVKYVSKNNVSVHEASGKKAPCFHAKLTVDKKTAKKAGLTARQIRELKKRVGKINKALKANKCLFAIDPIALDAADSVVTVKVKGNKLKQTKAGVLKNVKSVTVEANVNGTQKTFKLARKEYKAVVLDAKAKTVEITGRGKNFKGSVTVTVS